MARQLKKFTRTTEDFVCSQCGFLIKGTGYTSHCPKCLWSKHVDNNPGDRACSCRGMMEPVGVEQKSQTYRIIHHCVKCGVEKRNKVVKADDYDTILRCVRSIIQ
ncbi:MAG: RNHCP domain-containing protein [Patescibacteria group bacterium]